MARKLTPLVVIVGPTCSGKSGLGMKLAEYFNGEIICADSWTVRKGVDIGTAKPTPQDRRSIKHHLLDVIEPDAMFNAAEFKKLATKAIADISNRGKLPIMVGGSGLYIDGLLYNYSFLPPSKLRKKLNTLKLEELIKRADKLNLINTSIDLNNRRHLIRLIEANGDRPTRNELRSNTLIIGIETDRAVLRKRIEKRSNKMLKEGLEAEVLNIAQMYGWECEALKGVNYAQWRDYFLGKEDYPKLKDNLVKANMDLAKKQMTWFRRNKRIHWQSAPVNVANVVDLVTTFLDNTVTH